MANIALTSIGTKISYAIETVSGERPVSGYKVIDGMKSTPELNIAPSVGDTTSFANEKYTSKAPLLREMPDSLEFGAVFGQEFADKWIELYEASELAKQDNKRTWFCIDIKGFDKAFYIVGEPQELGLSALEVNSVIDYNVFVVPTGEMVVAGDPIYDGETTQKVTFVVKGAGSAPVEDAVVEIFGFGTVTTDLDGEAEFNLKSGTYDYKVSKEGITSKYGNTTVASASVTVNVTAFN